MRKSKKQRNKRSQRDNSNISRFKRLRRYNLVVDDFRTFSPEPVRSAHLFDGRRVTYSLTRPKQNVNKESSVRSPLTDRLSFASPRKTIVCHKRKVRRNVLFAKKRVGKGKKVSSLRRMTEFSNFSCRRS